MIKELRRFTVQNSAGYTVPVSEMAYFVEIDGRVVMDGVSWFATTSGTAVIPGERPDEYIIPKAGIWRETDAVPMFA